MPQTGLNIGPELSIALDGKHVFQPGDTIVGRVVRPSHIVSPRATVRVKLYGRTKSKVTVRKRTGGPNNNTTTTHYYRNRFALFEVFTTVFDGPVHVPPQGQPAEWLFHLDIPIKPWPVLATQQNQNSFLPLDPGSVARHGIPFTFFCEHNEYVNRTLECFAEYVVEATISYEHGSKTLAASATLPILIRPAASPRVADFDLRRTSLPGELRSQRLLPGREDAALSLKEKTAKLFHSSKIPKLVYKVEVDCPSALQLGISFPFSVRVVPDREASSDNIAKAEQLVTLTAARFKLKARTEVTCINLWNDSAREGVRRHEFDLTWKDPIALPFGAETDPLNIGTRMNLHLSDREFIYNGGSLPLETPVYPSFTTYNIQHHHFLKWQLTLSLARESFTFEGEQPVLVVAPPG